MTINRLLGALSVLVLFFSAASFADEETKAQTARLITVTQLYTIGGNIAQQQVRNILGEAVKSGSVVSIAQSVIGGHDADNKDLVFLTYFTSEANEKQVEKDLLEQDAKTGHILIK